MKNGRKFKYFSYHVNEHLIILQNIVDECSMSFRILVSTGFAFASTDASLLDCQMILIFQILISQRKNRVTVKHILLKIRLYA